MQARAAQSAVTGLAAFAMAALLLAVKAPDALRNAQFWAEDGSVFFAQQWGSADAPFWEPYAGYLHLIPRSVAWALQQIPLHWTPLAYNAAALLLESFFLAYSAMRLSAGRLGSACWFLLTIAVVPQAGDVFGTITNIQWFAQFVLVTATLRLSTADDSPVPSRGARFAEYALYVFCGLTGPFSVLWLMALLLVQAARVVLRKSPPQATQRTNWLRRDFIPLLALCAVVQFAVIFSSAVGTPEASSQMTTASMHELGLAHHGRHPYVAIANGTLRPQHLALAAIYLILACAVITAWLRLQSVTASQCLAAVVFGASQPIAAYLKQQALHTLSTPTHYFLMLGVTLTWATGLYVMKSKRLMVGLNIGAACVFVLGYARFPDYFRRAPLAPLGWQESAQRLEVSQHCELLPLNPLPWHAKVPPKGSGLSCTTDRAD